METISSRSNPIVKMYRALAREHRANERRMLLDGMHLIEAAREAGLTVRIAAFSSRLLDSRDPSAARLMRDLQASDARVVRVPDSVMAALSPVRTPSGVAAIADRPQIPLEQVLGRAPQLVIIVTDLQDPGNVGAVIRAAEAGGATGVVTCGATADPFGWKALRGSMGSAFRLPVISGQPAPTAVTGARARGLRIVAAVPRGGRSLYDADLTAPAAIVLGSEGQGLDAGLARQADELISVPMQPPVESLNVAVTAALFVYEAFRQRTLAAEGVARSREGIRSARSRRHGM